ncbi:MAG: PH domain-containing protein [Fibrobacter sp.]|nr:PH domain-containing protein [Fibrobacter sp.]MBQ5463100.1 PH domain-containing protein [Fibrobacter sp.]
MDNELKLLIGDDEKIIYAGKPNKKCFLFESIFNPLLPFALLWGLIDFGVIGFSMTAKDEKAAFFLVPFMLLHLMPVWIYLGGALLSFRRYQNTSYIVTDKAIYASGGVFSRHYNTKPFAELSHVDLHRGIFDQWFGVGDIITTSAQANPATLNGRRTSTNAGISIDSISNYIEVYNIVKKLQQDIYTDVMYPNDLRPKTNHGYGTKYRG